MPELPEVETIRTQLAQKLVGKTIIGVELLWKKSFEGEVNDVVGKKIVDVRRRAKILVIDLEGPVKMIVHLKMTGQLVYGESGQQSAVSGQKKVIAETVSFSQGIPLAGFTLPGKTTRVVFTLSGEGKLFFNDNRKFGWIRVVDEEELRIKNQELGPEPFDSAQGKPFDSAQGKPFDSAQGKPFPSKEFTPEYLQSICEKWRRPIKQLLMEQSKIAGIGNIYANEALWTAKINPLRRAKELSKAEVEELYKSILEVLSMGIKFQGSSAKDETFVNAFGEKGRAQEHFNVYQKKGEKCPRCGGEIMASKIGGRGTFYCLGCQK